MSVHRPDARDPLLCALTGAGDAAYVWDLAADTIDWSGALQGALGVAQRDAIATGRGYAGRINPEDLLQRQHALNRHLNGGEPFECEYRLRNEDGGFIWVQDRGAALFDDSGRAQRVTGIVRPVTGRKLAEARLEQLANFDELTGHFNKARLREALDHILSYSHKAGQSGAYLAVGIDNMTMINDAFGAEAADAVIVDVGRRLDRCLSISDVIGRVGGDRFGVLLGNCAEAKIGGTAERILTAISQTPIATAAGPIYVTASIGTVAFPQQAETAHDVMTRAETALADAKRAGRDCVVPYRLSEEQRGRHRASMAVGERVQRALKQERIVFAFQPVVAAETGEVDYYECLLRMIDEDGRIVAAGEFVPVVEQLGFIRLIDRYVLEKAVAELAAHPEVRLGINISGLTAAHRPWLRALTSLLEVNPGTAARLVIEITETAAVADLNEAGHFVASLRDLGCRVALDDFGAGFTSLRHLHALMVDTVKIDGSFVRNVAQSQENQIFLRHLVGLARSFGLATVAECVETADDAAILRREGVGFLQGYYFGKPSVARPWLATDGTTLRAGAAS